MIPQAGHLRRGRALLAISLTFIVSLIAPLPFGSRDG
jgi:hypothetical protein